MGQGGGVSDRRSRRAPDALPRPGLAATPTIAACRRGRAALDRRGDRKLPIRLTEFGASASAGRIKDPPNQHFQTTDAELAELLPRMYAALLAERKPLRVERAYWYTWASSFDQKRGGVFDISGLVELTSKGMVNAKPALAAYRRVSRP